MRLLCLFIGLTIGYASISFAQTTSPFSAFFKEKNSTPKVIDDVFFTIEKQGNGASPKRGDYVKLKYVGKLLDATVFDESKNEPFVFRLGYRQVIQGWEMAIPQLKIGTKATLYIPSNRAYGNRDVDKIPANSPLIFEVEMLEILSEAAYEKYNADLENKEKVIFEKNQKIILAQDIKNIAAYADENKLKALRTNTGLHYVVSKKGKGDFPKKGDLLSVEYEGSLLDGTVFDSNKDKTPFQFVLGAKKAMEGWEEGLTFFNKGSEGYLLIPSSLAYKGTAIADKGVPPNAVLIFKIKVKEIKKK